MGDRRRWTKGPVRKSEVVSLRVTPDDRLQFATFADECDVTEGDVWRRAALLGLPMLKSGRGG